MRTLWVLWIVLRCDLAWRFGLTSRSLQLCESVGCQVWIGGMLAPLLGGLTHCTLWGLTHYTLGGLTHYTLGALHTQLHWTAAVWWSAELARANFVCASSLVRWSQGQWEASNWSYDHRANERPPTDHLITGPMRGLKKSHGKGTRYDNDNRQTSRLLDQLGPEGRVWWKCNHP